MIDKQNNRRISRGIGLSAIPAEKDLIQFEQLPSVLRHAVRETAQSVASYAPYIALNEYGMKSTLRILREKEREEISRFAQQYKESTGQDYPFLAAQATVQRYNSSSTTRRHTRRYRQMWFDADSMIVPEAPKWRRRRH